MGKRRLRLDRTLNGIYGAAEFCQYAVPGSIGNPTAPGSNQAVKDVSPLVKSLRVPTSSAPIRRLYPSTSAAKIAISLRSVSSVLVKTRPRTAPTSLLRARRGGHLEIRVLRLVFRKMTMPAAGQTLPSSLGAARPLPPSADIGRGGQAVGQAVQFCKQGSVG